MTARTARHGSKTRQTLHRRCCPSRDEPRKSCSEHLGTGRGRSKRRQPRGLGPVPVPRAWGNVPDTFACLRPVLQIPRVKLGKSGARPQVWVLRTAVHLMARIGHVDDGLHDVRILVHPLVKGPGGVDCYAYDVLTLGDTSDIDPLTTKLLVVPVPPPGRNALERTIVAVALAATVLERIFETE